MKKPKTKRFFYLGLSLLVGIYSLSILVRPGTANAAAPYTCTWTGATNNNFNTAGNWSGCNSAAPQPTDSDNLVFDNTSLSGSVTVTNNISSLQVGSITFSGSNSNFYNYTLTGNAISIGGGITQNTNTIATLNLDLTLSADQTFSLTTENIIIGDSTLGTSHTLALGSHNLTLGGSAGCGSTRIYSALTGSGNIIDNVAGAGVSLNVDSPSYSGAISANDGILYANTTQALGASSAGTTVASGASLDVGFSADTTYAEPLTLAGTGVDSLGTIILGDVGQPGCSGGPNQDAPHTATFSGNIVLQSDVTVAGDASHNLAITGALSGAHTITVAPGDANTLIVNSSNNTSNTPNGTSTAPAQTITIDASDSQPNTSVDVGLNETYIINGVRGDVLVESGGTLKGSGTVGIVSVESGGNVAPGNSPGCLSTSDLDINGTYQAELGGTTACSEYDQLKVTGTVTLSDTDPATLSVSLYGGFQPKVGDSYTIIDNDSTDAVTGTFNNLPEGSTFSVDGYVFKISYVGGDGNDVVLTVQSVPAAPNTGLVFLKANPVVTLLGTTLVAGGILEIARRHQKLQTKH